MFKMICEAECNEEHSDWQVWITSDRYHKVIRQDGDAIYVKGEPEDQDDVDAGLICTRCWYTSPKRGWAVEVDGSRVE